jgi:hypothetical protein
MQKITFAPAWCNEHLAQCWHMEENGITRPLCSKESIQPAGSAELGAKIEELKEKGYVISHKYPQYIATRYKSQPLTLPLEWQILAESQTEPEYIDADQEW